MTRGGGERHLALRVVWGMRRCLVLLGVVGCVGGLDNRPLQQGVVRGQLTGDEAAGAIVFLRGSPELQARTGSDGRFSIAGVPQGACTLIASAPFHAAAVQGVVAGGQALELGQIPVGRAPGFVVVVMQQRAPLAGASVGIVDSPLEAVTDPTGRARLWALPAGTYRVGAQVGGSLFFEDVATSGEADAFSAFNLGALPDGGSDGALLPDAGPGCLATGCGSGQVCDPAGGRCYACLSSHDCPGGAACTANLCQPLVAPCAPCTDSSQCGTGGACLGPFDGGPMQCGYACALDADCTGASGYGYTCSQGVCRPNTAEISSCDGPAALGQPCSSSDTCRGMGLVLGVCESGSGGSLCTVACMVSSDCPTGLRCSGDDGGLCVP